MDDIKQDTRNQAVALYMVTFGAAVMALGCHFHYAELTTFGASVGGAGIQMLTTQIRNALNNRSSSVNVGSDAATM